MLDRDDTAPIQMTPACNARWLRSANSTASKARTATSNSRLVWRTAAGLWLAVAGISAGLLAEPSWAQEKSPLAAAPDTSVPAELIIGAERLSQVFRATAKQLKPGTNRPSTAAECLEPPLILRGPSPRFSLGFGIGIGFGWGNSTTSCESVFDAASVSGLRSETEFQRWNRPLSPLCERRSQD